MKPWAKDAGSIDIGELLDENDRRDESHKLVITPSGPSGMREFVHAPNIGSRLRVVVAPKGYGKTLLLRCRSQWLRQRHERSGVVFFPSGANDIEYLEVLLDVQEMYRIVRPIEDAHQWSRIWECAILVTACHACEAPTLGDAALDDLFPYRPSGLTLSNTLATVLRSMHSRDSLLSADIATLRGAFKALGRDVVIFADNADEAFRLNDLAGVGGRRKTAKPRPDIDAEATYDFAQDNVSSWKDLQAGLLLSIRSLDRHANSLRVYTSLRAEALNEISDPTLLQAKDHCADLRYPREALRRIFEANIDLYPRDQLTDPTAEHPVKRWLGIERLEHRFVRNPAGRPEVEDVFDFILRHSLTSPRDLMVIGEAIERDVVASLDQPESVISVELQRCVNHTAHSMIFSQWRQTAIPRWSDHYYRGLGQVSGNVLSPAALAALDEVVDEGVRGGVERVIPFSVFLYEHGLLGHAHKIPHHPHRQIFQSSWQQRFTGVEDRPRAKRMRVVPQSDRYFIHPLLNDVVRHHQHDAFSFDPDVRNIIGYDLPYYDTQPTLVVLPGECDWPCVRYRDDVLFDGSRPLTQPQQGLLVLCYAASWERSTHLPINTVVETFKALCRRFGEPSKSWLEALRNDPGHLNSSLRRLFTQERPPGAVASCIGKDLSKDLPAYVDFQLCGVDDIYIEPSAALAPAR